MDRANGALAHTLGDLHQLPSPRGAALKLLQLSAREDVSTGEVARVAQADPALAARLIHAAGTLGRGASRSSSILQAVLRLGFRATRQIALGFSLARDYRHGPCLGFDYQAFWTGSLLRGLAARAVAERLGAGDPQEALACGLLAEIGRLAFATSQPDAYAELLVLHGQRGAALRAAERERFGLDHGDLGSALLERWTVPADLVSAVEGYFSPPLHVDGPGRSARRMILTLTVAETLSRSLTASGGEREAWKHVAIEGAASLEVEPDLLDEAAREVAAELPDWAPLLDLPAQVLVQPEFQAYARIDPALSVVPAEPAANNSGLRILLVDDDESAALLAQIALEGAGHRVSVVTDARQALAAVLSELPQLVITDLSMPHMDGLALCRRLRETALARSLPIIALTGNERPEDLVESIAAGANDFVSKFSPPEVLLARVRAAARTISCNEELLAELAGVKALATNLAFALRKASPQ